MESSSDLYVQSLCKSYGVRRKIPALLNVSLSVAHGKCAALVGKNGAGKTTLLRILGGTLSRYKGKFELTGRVGFCPEVSTYFPYMDATENVEYFLKIVGSKTSTSALLKELSLVSRKQLAGTFSKGMKRKLDIARSLSVGAGIILMDEPFDGLDPSASYDLAQIINRLKNQGITFLLSSHDLYRVADVADSVFFMDSGRIVEEFSMSSGLRFLLKVEGDSTLSVNVLNGLGCNILENAGKEIHFDLPSGTMPWNIIGELIKAGVKIIEFSEQRLDSEYRRVLVGNGN